jgi:hypothetical protein
MVLGVTAAFASALAVGCYAEGEEVGGSQGAQVANVPTSAQQALSAVVMLPGGCLGTKVGPKVVLVSARCLIGREEMTAGSEIRLVKAASADARTIIQADDEDDDAGAMDAGAPTTDSGAAKPADGGAARDAGASTDAGSAKTTPAGAIDITLTAVHVHPSFAAKCKTEAACAPGSVEASDAPDVALLEADAEIKGIPAVPVDLDAVSEADAVFVAAVGCDQDGKPAGKVKSYATTAIAAKSVNHTGSPYKAQPQFTTRLGTAYVVTQGRAAKDTAPAICAADFGGPLLRPAGAGVVGVHSGFTTLTDGKLPVTAHHTRVDATSRFKVGTWLQKLGAETVKTCSESTDGCVKNTTDAGSPGTPSTTPDASTGSDGGTSTGDGGGVVVVETDGGADASAEAPVEPPVPGTETSEGQLPGEDEYVPSGEDYDPSEVAPKTTKKKKATDSGGCSAAPGRLDAGAATWLLAVVGVVLSRRRRKAA